jgi:spore coat protein U-like protein
MTLHHKYMLSLAQLAACATLFALMPEYSHADDTSCRFTTVTAVGFGAYDVFSGTPNNNGVGSLRIRCQGGGSKTFIVRLSTGQSHIYSTRVMRSGANVLTYNLYTSAARNVVWGDGTGGSSTMAVNRNSTTTLSLYGQIPAGQDVAVGIYSDNITATVDF